jgi:hypothetical protein
MPKLMKYQEEVLSVTLDMVKKEKSTKYNITNLIFLNSFLLTLQILFKRILTYQLIHQYGVEWPRDCPLSKFCFKATTTDIERARTLLDFTWVCNNLISIKSYYFISLYWRTINHIYVTVIF